VGLLKSFTSRSKRFEAARLRRLCRRFKFANDVGKFNIKLTNNVKVYDKVEPGESRFNLVVRNPLHAKLRVVLESLRQNPTCLRLGLLLAIMANRVLGSHPRSLVGFHTQKYTYRVYLLGIASHANGRLWRKFCRSCLNNLDVAI
jgi:hypothetical protein